MNNETILMPSRQTEVCAAFAEWYGKQEKKKEAMNGIGRTANMADLYIRGVRYPPASALAVLWSETKDTRFLFTREEKTRRIKVLGKRCHGTPTDDEWPDLDNVSDTEPKKEKKKKEPPPNKHRQKDPPKEKPPGIPDLLDRLKGLTDEIQKLADLPGGDPVREVARHALRDPAMRLFRVATALKLKFPEEFTDLLEQLDMAGQIFGENNGKEKRR
jgi:hypothetical protein